MEKREPKNQFQYSFDEQGANEVSMQIMNAYNSGVIDQKNGNFELDAQQQGVSEGKLQ